VRRTVETNNLGGAVTGAPKGAPPAIEFRDVSVSFGGVQALSNVSFRIERGEIVSVMGENGAGKSTLMKVASGLVRRSSGTVTVNGVEHELVTTSEAHDAGIRLVPQELTLANDLSVAENISLGQLPRRNGVLSRAAMNDIARARLARLGAAGIDVEAPVEDLSVIHKTFVQIARALSDGATLLILDEPTGPMSDAEVSRLLDVVREIAREGIGIAYISHRLDEVFSLSSRVVVLRDGRTILDKELSETKPQLVIEAMVGGRNLDVGARQVAEDAALLLEVRGLTAAAFADVSFSVRAGEIVGLYGVAGSGREEIGAAIVGDRQHVRGEVVVEGTPIVPLSIRGTIAAGVGYLAPERRALGLLFESTIRENVTLSNLGKFTRGGVLRKQGETVAARDWIDKLQIAAPSTETIVGSLSGGSQQKVLIARALESAGRVLVLEEPTRGVDIATKAEIYRLLADLAHSGLAILVITSDIEEVALVSSRVLVMRRGTLVPGDFAPDQTTIALAASATKEEPAA
jgi:rhamnose transport system ATP-binding protein